ncbi:MAG: YkgJ family cysteine cluster protein, partial [Candidatus Korobacteraceae bacterium]
MHGSLPAGDQKLVQIIDSALADTARRSGEWLVCKLGCTQCCLGAFAINQLDVLRLQQGLADLEASDSARAAQVRERARASLARIKNDFPGDPATGILD